MLVFVASSSLAQYDPIDRQDLDGFLSAGAVTGRPTLFSKPEALQDILNHLAATPVSPFDFSFDSAGGTVVFNVELMTDPAEKLDLCDDEDVLALTYDNRSCVRERDVRVRKPCHLTYDGCPHFVLPCYKTVADVPVDRCSKAGSGRCTEFRIVAINTRFFVDPECSFEMLDDGDLDVEGLRCPL